MNRVLGIAVSGSFLILRKNIKANWNYKALKRGDIWTTFAISFYKYFRNSSDFVFFGFLFRIFEDHTEFAHTRPLNMALILMGVFEVDYTGWLNSTVVENYLVRKTMVDLVVNHIEFAHIRPLNMVLILMGVFELDFTGWLNSTVARNHVVIKIMVDLVVHHTDFASIWPLNMVFRLIGVF